VHASFVCRGKWPFVCVTFIYLFLFFSAGVVVYTPPLPLLAPSLVDSVSGSGHISRRAAKGPWDHRCPDARSLCHRQCPPTCRARTKRRAFPFLVLVLDDGGTGAAAGATQTE